MCTPPRAPRHADDRGVWRYVIRRCAQALELKLADACGAVALVELGPTPASARRACAFSGGAQQPLQLSGHRGTRRLGRAATAAQVTATAAATVDAPAAESTTAAASSTEAAAATAVTAATAAEFVAARLHATMPHLRSQQLGLLPPPARLEGRARGLPLPSTTARHLTLARLRCGQPRSMRACHQMQ